MTKNSAAVPLYWCWRSSFRIFRKSRSSHWTIIQLKTFSTKGQNAGNFHLCVCVVCNLNMLKRLLFCLFKTCTEKKNLRASQGDAKEGSFLCFMHFHIVEIQDRRVKDVSIIKLVLVANFPDKFFQMYSFMRCNVRWWASGWWLQLIYSAPEHDVTETVSHCSRREKCLCSCWLKTTKLHILTFFLPFVNVICQSTIQRKLLINSPIRLSSIGHFKGLELDKHCKQFIKCFIPPFTAVQIVADL